MLKNFRQDCNKKVIHILNLRRPIHQDHGGASVDAKAPAKPVVNADAVTGRQAVRAWWSGKPDEADEVGLPGIRGHTSSSGVVRARAVSTIGLGNFAFTGETASWQG